MKLTTKIILIILALIVGGFLAQTGIYIYKIKTGKITDASFEKKFTSAKQLSNTAKIAKTDEILSATAPSYGAANPKLTIVEFGNFACPYSKEASGTAREIMLKNKDKIKFIYRDFPLDDIYPDSTVLSLAGKCADEQKKFWPAHDKLYGPGEINAADFIQQIGLNEDLFSVCLANKKYLSAIQKDFVDGYKNGVIGTPTFFFIKTGAAPIKIQGAIPKETFQQIIQNLLKS